MWKTRWIKWITRQAYPIFQAFSAFGRWKNRWIKWKTPKITHFARRFMSTCNIHFAYTLPGAGAFRLRVSPRERRVKSGAHFVDRQYRGGGFFPPPYFFARAIDNADTSRCDVLHERRYRMDGHYFAVGGVRIPCRCRCRKRAGVCRLYCGGQQCFRFRNAFRGDLVCAGLAIIHVLRLQRSVNGHCCAYTQDHGVDKKPFYKKGGSVK